LDAQYSRFFVTLTYPQKWPEDWTQWKRDIAAMRKRIGRRYDGSGGVWRIAKQERGAPPFHIVLVAKTTRRRLSAYLAASWGAVAHNAAGVHVMELTMQNPDTPANLREYIAIRQTPVENAGRSWGRWGL